MDRAATVYPAIAWWNGSDGGLAHADASFRRWPSHDFSTDWGLRDVAASDPLYDPISYHQGSVWPLFTGWMSVAEYSAGRALSGYAHLMQNADQTTTQDLGAVTELLPRLAESSLFPKDFWLVRELRQIESGIAAYLGANINDVLARRDARQGRRR